MGTGPASRLLSYLKHDGAHKLRAVLNLRTDTAQDRSCR
jgi:hypothetical protein